ncbi:MAG: crtF [Myxococcaceae bacterium]|nr:crtF [Myxococcaceae bacterium]
MTATALRAGARGLMSLLFHGAKARDVLETASRLGVLRQLDAGPVTLGAMSLELGVVPLRLYKLLDCLESLGLVERIDSAEIEQVRYVAIEPLHDAAILTFGPESVERDRDAYDWASIHGRLDAVLRGQLDVPSAAFSWPPRTPEQVAGFEASMARGVGPILEAFCLALPKLWPRERDLVRWLDIGGGDGTLVRELLLHEPLLHGDVLNLPATEPLVRPRLEDPRVAGRMGFVPGDFFAGALPAGYDLVSLVRVLHDWPARDALTLLERVRDALPSGGRLVICEELRSPSRLAVQFFWSYFLIGVDSCVSRLREVEFYLRALDALGMKDIEVIPGPFDIVTAVR